MSKVDSDSTIRSVQSFVNPNNARRGNRIDISMIQNILLIWLDGNIDKNSDDCQTMMTQLRRAVNTIEIFTDGEGCIQFLEEIPDEKACVIISGHLGQRVVPRLHDLAQIDSILIFCANRKYHEKWSKDWSKIKGVFTEIQPMYDALKQAADQCEQNAISMSIMNTDDDLSKKNLDELDPSFMYTMIMKEIFLAINFEQQHIDEFIQHCRKALVDNASEMKNVEQLAVKYKEHTPIWWYTCECFLYPMLNRALRMMDVDVMIKLGFFISDLHRQIQELHRKQLDNHDSNQHITVYRGQGMEKEAFKKLAASTGGILAFNCFLSTSKNREVSLGFAKNALANSKTMGILFVMAVNSAAPDTFFASVTDVGYFGGAEGEVLFSMHTVFRIGQITPLDGTSRLFQVELTLSSDKDTDLCQLIDRVREETFPDKEGWFRLGLVSEKMNQFAKAQQIFETLLEQATDDNTRGPIYHQLGLIKDKLGEYDQAIAYYEKSIEIEEQQTPRNYQNIAQSYNDIGWVYHAMGDHQKALSFCEKALAIRTQSCPSDHFHLASSYNRIGIVYQNIGDYSKALSSCEKALSIRQQSLPPNHPDLAASYGNIGSIYDAMGDYEQALSFYEKSLEICQQSLPPTHLDLAMSYNNIGNIYDTMGNYAKALSSHEKALEIKQQSLPPTHFELLTSYVNIGNVYYGMGDHAKALLFYEKTLEIGQQSLSSTQPALIMSCNNIGLVYKSMGDYPKALSFHERALAIKEQSLPPTHPSLAMTYYNMGLVHENMDNYSEAYSCFERAVDIAEHSLPPNHPHLEMYRNRLSDIKEKLW